jgi:hypothetical protein
MFRKQWIWNIELGLQYNLHYKMKDWLTNVALGTESAINHFPQTDRDYYSNQVSQNMIELHQQSCSEPNQNIQREKITLNAIQSKQEHT